MRQAPGHALQAGEREVRRLPAARRIGLAFPERAGIGRTGPQLLGKPAGELVEYGAPQLRVAGKRHLRAAVGVVGVQAQPMPAASIPEPPGQVQRMGRPEEARQGIRAQRIEHGHSRERREPVGPVEQRPAHGRASPLEPDCVVGEALGVVSWEVHGHVRVREHEPRWSQSRSLDPGAEPFLVDRGSCPLGRAGARRTKAADERQREAGRHDPVSAVHGCSFLARVPERRFDALDR